MSQYDGWDDNALTRSRSEELYRVRERLDRAIRLLKQAGDNLDIRTSQEVRALRFKIIQFLEAQDGH